MAKKMAKVVTTPRSREEILTKKWMREGANHDVGIPRYPTYAAKSAKSNTA